jgi:hypothetical protein
LLKEFVLAVFVKCVTEEVKLYTDIEDKKASDIFLQIKPRFMTLAKDYYRCTHFICLLVDKDGNLAENWK